MEKTTKTASHSVAVGGEQDELVYFNLRGRAETIRLLYIVSERAFKDTRIEFGSQEWADIKDAMPFRQLPILKRGSVVIPQSMAIARLVAKETGLAGSTVIEQALVDSIVDAIEEFANPGVDIFVFEMDEAKKAVRAEEFLTTILPPALENLDRQIGNNPKKSGFFIGDKMLLCDILFYVVADRFVRSDSKVLSKYSHLQSLYEKVAAHPKINAWIKKRPDTPI